MNCVVLLACCCFFAAVIGVVQASESLATCEFIDPTTQVIKVHSKYFNGPVEYTPLGNDGQDKLDRESLQGGMLCPFRCKISAVFVRHQKSVDSVEFGRWWAPITKPNGIAPEESICFKIKVHDMITDNTLNVCPEFISGAETLFRAHETANWEGICGWTNKIPCKTGNISVLPERNTFQIFIPRHDRIGNAQAVTPRPDVDRFLGKETQLDLVTIRAEVFPILKTENDQPKVCNGEEKCLAGECSERKTEKELKALESDLAALLTS